MEHYQRNIPIGQIKPNPRNTRTHSSRQIRQIAESIRSAGFTSPVVVDEHFVLVAGEGRWAAARQVGLKEIPAVVLVGLSEAKKRVLLLADNKIAANAGWDRKRLSVEIAEVSELLIEEGLEISGTGFEPAEIDQLATDFEIDSSEPSDDLDTAFADRPPVSKSGDLWALGDHRLLCGDARNKSDIARLTAGQRASAAFLDPPYNLKIKDIVGRGRIKHPEFSMASGEMTRSAFSTFLIETLGTTASFCHDGAVHFVCMDWRHLPELLAAGERVYSEMLNLVVWVKSNAGQGSFYRSQHELLGVYRIGYAPSLNNVALGRHGRNRSNVWHFAGANSFRAGRMDDLRNHPTCKPVALVADALRDCTRRADLVLDTFSGSGTTIMAAERVGRVACALEIEPHYVDVAIRRWQSFTGKDAVHLETGHCFQELASTRAVEGIPPRLSQPSVSLSRTTRRRSR